MLPLASTRLPKSPPKPVKPVPSRRRKILCRSFCRPPLPQGLQQRRFFIPLPVQNTHNRPFRGRRAPTSSSNRCACGQPKHRMQCRIELRSATPQTRPLRPTVAFRCGRQHTHRTPSRPPHPRRPCRMRAAWKSRTAARPKHLPNLAPTPHRQVSRTLPQRHRKKPSRQMSGPHSPSRRSPLSPRHARRRLCIQQALHRQLSRLARRAEQQQHLRLLTCPTASRATAQPTGSR